MKIIKKSTMHPAIYQYENKSGTLWGYRIKFYDDNNKRREKRGSKFLNERDAFEDLVQVQYKINKGLLSNANSFTVSEWFQKHIEMNKPNDDGLNGNWSFNTYRNRLSVYNDYINPLIGDIKLEKLTLSIYQSLYIDQLKKTLSPSSIDLYHTFMVIAINAAVKYKAVQSNNINDATLPKIKETHEDKFIEVEDLKIFLNDIDSHENITNRSIIRFLAYTGVRVGEMRALKWKYIDFYNRKIKIYAQMTKHKYGPCKGNNKRIIPIDQETLRMLVEYKKWFTKRKSGILNQDDFVFITPQTGKVISANTLHYVFKRSNERTGLKISPHTLRHTHSAVLIMQNRSLTAISKRLGNSEEVLKEHYGHVIDSVDIDTMQAFSEAINNKDGANPGADLEVLDYKR